MHGAELQRRIADLIRQWHVTVEETRETQTSVLALGTRQGDPVVLKVTRQKGDEWRAGEVLQAFRGNGVVRVHERAEGAVLLERVIPGDSLVSMATGGQDEEATAILSALIGRMSGCTPPPRCPTVYEWGKGFERYLATRDPRVPRPLVEEAARCHGELAASQRATMLLHGDLHHYNVLRDARRGWLAIDPKGVVGEVEYELGAVLRNPIETPALFATPKTVELRLQHFARTLHLDIDRALRWAFTQAVLSAIWEVEDGVGLTAKSPVISFANTLRAMFA